MTSHPIVWAIDLYQENTRMWKRSKELAACVSRTLGQPLQPVYISDTAFFRPLSSDLATKVKQAKDSSRTRMKRLLKPLHDSEVNEPAVLQAFGFNEEVEAKKVGRYAIRSKAPLILAATEGRRGLARAIGGSFVETLVAKSRVPVLLVNQESRPVREIRNIVFVTDLSRASNLAFKKICDFALAANARIEVLSILPDPALWGAELAAPVGVGYSANIPSFASEKKRLKRIGDRLVRLGREKGLDVSLALESNQSASVVSAILDSESVSDANLLAIAATRDTSKLHFFGSVAQEVIRRSPIPVWTCRVGT